MKIKCNATVSMARQDDRSKPNIQLYKDEVLEVLDSVALSAIKSGFAVEFVESNAIEDTTEDTTEDVIEEKMIEDDHKNKMFSDTHKNKNNDRKKGKKGKKAL